MLIAKIAIYEEQKVILETTEKHPVCFLVKPIAYSINAARVPQLM